MLALTMEASHRPRVAVCFAATAKNSNVGSYEQTPMARLSIPSTKRTAPQAHIYIGIDDDDILMLKWKEKMEHDATVIVTPGRKNHIPFNEITRKAYEDGADYIVRINDDTEFITEGWVKLGIAALESMKPPNVGVVAPVCKQNTAIFTHDMVHRTHLKIFDVYYPVIFDNWYVDTWITQVYQPDRSKLVKGWEVRHHLAKTRYRVDRKQRRNLADEVERGKTKITKWVNKRTEATTSVDCKKYFPTQLSSATKNGLTKLLSWTQERLAPAGIDFTIALGTALGYARTQSMLPWDDDIDIVISKNDFKRAQKLITAPEMGFCTANLWLGFKVFFCKSPKIGKYAWGYPLIDVFSTKESGGGGIKKDIMFPSKPGILLGVEVGTPRNLPEHLKARYRGHNAINKCYSQHYNHSTESRISDRKTHPCVDVYKQCYGIDLKGQEKGQVDAKKRVVSYSLYGANPRYTDGAVANADLAPSIYPGWEMWIYHDESVPGAVLSDLRTRSWVKLINMQNQPIKNQMVWRFLVSSSSVVERYIIRDIDSRLSMREKEAVDEWIESGARFHVMRDHPSHSKFAMSGGMWGGTMDAVPDMEARLTQRRKMNRDYLQDMNFLNDVIWPIAQKSLVQHDSFSCDKFGGGHLFPTKRIGWEHVGSVYIDGKMRQGDVDILKRAGVVDKCVQRVDQIPTGAPRTCFPRALGPEPSRKGQIDDSTTFASALTALAKRPDVRRIFEIGTWYGGGSTQAFVDGLKNKADCVSNTTHHCCNAFLTTFEIFEPAWNHARFYHQNNPVWLVQGTTVGVEQMLRPDQIPSGEKGEHYQLYYERDRKIMENNLPQLEEFCRQLSPDVVLIDGNEYTGWGEFQITMEACRPSYIALHDTGTLKTFEVEKFIQGNPTKFELIAKGKDGAGWAIHKVTQRRRRQLQEFLPSAFKIIILTQRRHAALQRLLISLDASHYGNHAVHLEIRVDYDDSLDHEKTIELARMFEFTHGTKAVYTHDTVQGLQRAWFGAWTPASESERAVILEDDMELSPLWFTWLQRAWDNYGERDDLGGISLCRQRLRASDGMSIMKQHDAPFLYRVVGSFGFSPNARYWKPFVAWAKTPAAQTADLSVAGTITSQWYKSMNPGSAWTFHWIWWCWHQRTLHTLYVHSPNGALITHWAEPGVHSRTKSAPNDRLLKTTEPVLEAFPPTLMKFGWDFEPEPNNICYQKYLSSMSRSNQENLVMGKTVMMDPTSVRLLCKYLRPEHNVLEWGSGGSTAFYSQFVKSWNSIEHDEQWAKKVEIYRKEHLQNVVLHTVPVHSWSNHPVYGVDGFSKDFYKYINLPKAWHRKFDVILVDGRARVDCALSVLKNNLLAAGGVVIIHDWERLSYKPVLLKYNLIEEDTSSPRHLGVLAPCSGFRELRDDTGIQPVIWSNDFHISTIANIKNLLRGSAHFIDKSLSGHCHLTKTCATELKVLTQQNGISPSPAVRRAFADAYRNDPEFATVDIVMCFHPSAMCELFMPLNKRLFVIATTRYEMGRHSKDEWLAWNENLKRIAADPKNVVAANNLYDAKYIEYFTGIKPVVWPSVTRMRTVYQPSSTDILVPDMHSPGSEKVWNVLRKLSANFVPLRSKYSHYTYEQLCENTAILHLPYQISVMSLFEQYSMGIPIIVPSPDFLWKLHDKYDLVTERTWERIRSSKRPTGSVLPGVASGVPDPNNDRDKDSFLYWVRFADFYQWPHVLTFDSWDDLLILTQTVDWTSISKKMRKNFTVMFSRAQKDILRQVERNF